MAVRRWMATCMGWPQCSAGSRQARPGVTPSLNRSWQPHRVLPGGERAPPYRELDCLGAIVSCAGLSSTPLGGKGGGGVTTLACLHAAEASPSRLVQTGPCAARSTVARPRAGISPFVQTAACAAQRQDPQQQNAWHGTGAFTLCTGELGWGQCHQGLKRNKC